MSSLYLLLLIVFLQTAELRHSQRDLQESHPAAGAPAAGSERSLHPGKPERYGGSGVPVLRRVPRGARDGSPRRREPPAGSHSHSHGRRHEDPSGYFTTPRGERLTPAAASPGNHSSSSSGRGPGLLNPLFPVTEGSYWAYGVMLLALVLFAAGIVGNLALMCIVWHNFYLKSAWNCILAGLALWDFLVLFFCLPVVVFHELTLKRLLGDLSCRLVPFMEVSSLGVATFSLCALSIDRFHAATRRGPLHAPAVEPCQSILSKLAVIWLGSLLLAAPELLLWQLLQERVGLPPPPPPPPPGEAGGPGTSLMAALRARSGALVVDVCVREPSVELPEGVYALILTYQEARMWWIFGCYICLPLLFTMACDLVTRQVLAQREPQKPAAAEKAARCSSSSSSSSASSKKQQQQQQQTGREQRLRTTVMALTGLYVACNLPESVCGITLAYVSAAAAALPAGAEAALGLAGHFLLWLRCAAAPLLLLCLCRSLGQAFMDCCCCCCDECLPDAASSSAASTAATSALSSPTSPSPSSLSPSSLSPSAKEEAAKVLLPIEPAVCFERPKDCSEALGTPC